MELCPIEKCEAIELPQGKIYLGPSDKEKSVGYLELNSNQKLERHNRPVDEKLIQIKGVSTILFDDDEKILENGMEILIPANQFHIHSNDSDEISLTYWEFNGDLTEIINKIRKLQ